MNKNSQLYIDSKNRHYCVCIEDYFFNPNEYFDGIHFHKGDTYIVDMGSFLKNENSDLIAVIHHSDVFVGMSIHRFREHFKVIEGEKADMTLYDFIEMAIETIYDCYIWDNHKEKNIFEGKICDIPDELLEHEITSWEISEGKIGFNIV